MQSQSFFRKIINLLLCTVVLLSCHVISNLLSLFFSLAVPQEDRMLSQPTKNLFTPNCFHGGDILLIIVYNVPFYDTIPLIRAMYTDAFPNIVICGTETSSKYKILVVKTAVGAYGYACMTEAIRQRPHFKGYLYLNDDMIVDWWRFVQFDKSKIWIGFPAFFPGYKLSGDKFIIHYPVWAQNRMRKLLPAVENVYKKLNAIREKSDKAGLLPDLYVDKAFRTLRMNGNGSYFAFAATSDIFYMPGRFTTHFVALSEIFYDNKVFLEIAVPTIISMLDRRSNVVHIPGLYLWGSDRKNFIQKYRTHKNIVFLHPFKLLGIYSAAHLNFVKERIRNLTILRCN